LRHSSARKAGAKRTLEECQRTLPKLQVYTEVLLGRLASIKAFVTGQTVLDVGAAQGCFLVTVARMGFHACGVEPYKPAVQIAEVLARKEDVQIEVKEGTAERIPYPDNAFDAVFASNVMEHVADVETAFAEISRVLKPGGVFWFCSASSLSPRQEEIDGFPMFGWYPGRLKRRIMFWAKENKPQLIGFTDTPAINWFTPASARRMLLQAGFSQIYDRWDLRRPTEGGKLYWIVLSIIRSSVLAKLIADIIVPGCSYAAVKNTILSTP
jgi:ubiquinone/menaquinone biosynthesis C-methylase UbiE